MSAAVPEAIRQLVERALSQEATLKELVERGAEIQRMLDKAEKRKGALQIIY